MSVKRLRHVNRYHPVPFLTHSPCSPPPSSNIFFKTWKHVFHQKLKFRPRTRCALLTKRLLHRAGIAWVYRKSSELSSPTSRIVRTIVPTQCIKMRKLPRIQDASKHQRTKIYPASTSCPSHEGRNSANNRAYPRVNNVISFRGRIYSSV